MCKLGICNRLHTGCRRMWHAWMALLDLFLYLSLKHATQLWSWGRLPRPMFQPQQLNDYGISHKTRDPYFRTTVDLNLHLLNFLVQCPEHHMQAFSSALFEAGSWTAKAGWHVVSAGCVTWLLVLKRVGLLKRGLTYWIVLHPSYPVIDCKI